MLSDEEKEAIEKLSGKKNETTWDDTIRQIKREEIKDVVVTRQKYITAVLKIIEKQSKEIEHQIEKRANQRNELAILNAKQIEFNKLVNTVNSYKGQFKRQEKEIEELKEDKYGLEEEVQIQAKNLMLCEDAIKETYTKIIDKIKAKIEDLKENSNGDDFNLTNVIMILRSLLEKE